MNIVITEMDGSFGVTIFSYDRHENAQQVQEELKQSSGGSENEKVVGFLSLPDGEALVALLTGLCCSYGNGLEGSFYYDLEKLLSKVFELGKEHGLKCAKENEKHTCCGQSCWSLDCVDCYPLEHCKNHGHYFNEVVDCENCPDFSTCIRMKVHAESKEYCKSGRCGGCSQGNR